MAQDTAHMQCDAPKEHMGEEDLRGPQHRTRVTTQQASGPVNKSKVAPDAAHATQQSEPAHR